MILAKALTPPVVILPPVNSNLAQFVTPQIPSVAHLSAHSRRRHKSVGLLKISHAI